MLGVDSWTGERLPDGKVERLRAMQKMDRKVMYVGDGINDGPALATSPVGVAVGAVGVVQTSSIAAAGIRAASARSAWRPMVM